MITKKINLTELKQVIVDIIKEEYSKDPNIEIFLQKVKGENPDKFGRFLGLIRSHGLDVAKEKYAPFDKELIKNRTNNDDFILQNKKLIDSFVRFLPKKLLDFVNLNMKKTGEGFDGAFYFTIGNILERYSERYGPEKADKIEILMNFADDQYEDYFFEKIDEKYGKGVFEW